MTKVETTELQSHLEKLYACREARAWAADKSPLEAWEQCQRADWMLWWAAKTKANTRHEVVLACCACARTALKYVSAREDRPRLAIEAAERWANDPTPENLSLVRAARRAAGAEAAAAWAAGAAAWAAAWAGAAEAAEAWAGAEAAEAWAAAWAAWAAEAWAAGAAGAGGSQAHIEMCTLIRERLTLPWKGAAK